ncbi:hypothetical protein EXU57_11320 [Segetibacter sp. 3557_3]|uniref:hypothetical protein n=1 Tax=Segetibacter sp. 3557_3 TaxID=2547429 RepID=UPI0010587642|nr:hypothetical protein [Segetibacter sp. 3557_3]TDH26083.1 hypothetical protein EXU57_11320 [Segetibacter sp. 3557_3]
MKVIKHFTLVLATVLLFWACQKEYSLEGSGANGVATGSLKDTSNNCLPITVFGTYLQDSTLTDSNYVLVQANITNPGSYVIFTDVVNGISFRDSGFIPTTGLQTFKLKGRGKPVLTGPNDYTLSFGTSLCSFSVVTGVSGSAANFTLGTTAGACTQANVQGTYQIGSPLSTNNRVVINLTVTTPGTYSITTTTAGGMSFRATGTFVTTGPQTVTLQGTGTPTTAGNNTITLTAGGSSCTFNVNVTQAGPAAAFALGTAGNCSSTVAQGTYATGTALTPANRADVSVNVTTPGTYQISSTPVSGITFTGSGVFTTTGVQTVTLTASGTPTTAGPATIALTGGGTTCSFIVNVTAGSGGGNINQSDSAWSFNQGTTFFRGKIDTAFTATIPGLGFALVLFGPSTNVPGDTLEIDILFPGTSIQPGTYPTVSSSIFNFYSAAGDIYAADPQTTGVVTNVVVTSYAPLTRIIEGTFSGTAKNATGANVPITNGKFRAVVN